jgi:hypothetical protein
MVRTPRTNKREKTFLLKMTHDEHEYLCRLAYQMNESASTILRGLVFRRGWYRDLIELKMEQKDMSLVSMSGRHLPLGERRKPVNELDLPGQGPHRRNGGWKEGAPGLSEGRPSAKRGVL